MGPQSLKKQTTAAKATPKVKELFKASGTRIRFDTGKWEGEHSITIVGRHAPNSGRSRGSWTAEEELLELQGEWQWELNGQTAAQFFVRGRRVEEKRSDGRRFFSNLTKAGGTGEKRLLSQAELFSAASAETKPDKGTRKGFSKGLWLLQHHSSKELMWPDARWRAGKVVWSHPDEEIVWTRGG